MSDLEIRCSRCGGVLTHYCNETLGKCLKKLFGFKLEGTYKKVCQVDGENASFFSEVFLYGLLGKDDARTVLAALNNFIVSMGIDPRMSTWPKAECRHQFYETVGRDRYAKPNTEWCENCGAVRHYDNAGKPGEWKTPVNKEPKP